MNSSLKKSIQEVTTLFSYLQLKMCRPGLRTSDESGRFDINTISHVTAATNAIHFHKVIVSFWRFTMTCASHPSLSITSATQTQCPTKAEYPLFLILNQPHRLWTATIIFSWNMYIQNKIVPYISSKREKKTQPNHKKLQNRRQRT